MPQALRASWGQYTQDYALYNASLKEAINGTHDPNKSKDYPTTISIWDSFFESYNTWPGVKFSHRFNLAKGAVGAAAWEALERTAALACKVLSNDNLDAWEYANEPNNYPTSAQGPARPRGWSARDFANEWLNGTRGINKQIRKHCPELADFGFMAPSYDDRVSNLNATQVWGYGLDKYGSVKWYSVHKAPNHTRHQQYQAFQPIDTNKTSKGTKAPYYGSIGVAAALGGLITSSVSVSSIPMPSDQEAAYLIFERGNLKRLMVINMHGYNTTKDGAGTEPLPNTPGRMSRGFSFAARNLARDVSIREQRLMTNGSDAITGVTFDEWSYNWELDNGKPVRLDNVTTGETVRSKQGVITVMVPDKMVVVVVVVVVEKTLDEDGALESRSSQIMPVLDFEVKRLYSL
ncbi:glycoside hydrolase family 79 [Metarhizium brunneum]